MFDEFQPVIKELVAQPIAFLGGFASGLLNVDLAQDPVKSWLDEQLGTSTSPRSSDRSASPNGPQTISIE